MPDGSWGVNGVDMSALSPIAYAAMYKLMRLEDMQEGDVMPILRDSCDKVCGFVDDRRRSECGGTKCNSCRREFWTQEVE